MLKIKDHFKLLLDHISPNTEGIIWFTKEKLSERPPLFAELDYITNGLLTNFIRENPSYFGHKNLFLTPNFNRNLFVAHLHGGELSKSDLESEMQHIVEWTRQFFPATQKHGEIILVNSSFELNFDKTISKYSKSLAFTSLPLN